LLERQSNPTIAPLATPQGVTLRLTAKAATLEQANQLILPVEEEIRNAVGEFLYGVNEETLAGRLFEMLVQHQLTIAAAESLTAGLFTATLADVPGTSQVLAGGLTVYSLQEKAKQLGIDEEELSQHGVVSEWCAKAMARQVQKKFSSSIGVGLTGVAGPDPLEGQSVGTVWLGFAIEDEVFAERVQLSGLRQTIREKSVQHAYLRLIQYLKERH
ncbi:MAG TPA: nicotinamide-nucleotide amidohydrolase family protein, partial [Savagea sp.]